MSERNPRAILRLAIDEAGLLTLTSFSGVPWNTALAVLRGEQGGEPRERLVEAAAAVLKSRGRRTACGSRARPSGRS